MDAVTNNLSLIQMTTGTASGTWGTILNASMIAITDAALGNTVSVSVSSSDVNLTTTQRQNLGFNLTGTLTGNINVTLPLSPNSTTVAVGGEFIFANNSTGSFSVTVKTIASGSTGVEVPQGVQALLYSDGTNVRYADDTQNRTITYNGDPNGNVAGSAGSASTRASRVINRATNEEYLCTTSGTASVAVWSKNLPYSFASQGYLTANSDATSPVLTSDSIGATTLYYTALVGNLIFLYNGVSFVPITIPGGQLSLALSSSAQAANGIYDVLGFLNGTSLVVGFSPAWTTPTAGSGARGTGAGSPQLTRINGVLVNAVQQTANNGATTYTVAANRGTYLGSVAIDSSAGQVTCHVTYGQSRKWGVWNAYNRLPIILQVGDPTATWTYNTQTFRPSNGSVANSLTTFNGIPEEWTGLRFIQNGDANGVRQPYLGIGVNSTSSPTGFTGQFINNGASGGAVLSAYTDVLPSLGKQTITCLEKGGGTSSNWYGTATNMILRAEWLG